MSITNTFQSKINSEVRSLNRKLIFLCLIFVVFVGYFPITYYYLFEKDTGTNYSFVQKWQEYYSAEDWNLSRHARVDIDGDNQEDMITFTHCAFLSTMTSNDIPEDQHCTAEGMSTLVFPEENKIGQALPAGINRSGVGIMKSYLVKDNQGDWYYYVMNGMSMAKYKMMDDHLFNRVLLSPLDYVDLYTYQLTHLGVTPVVFLFLIASIPYSLLYWSL